MMDKRPNLYERVNHRDPHWIGPGPPYYHYSNSHQAFHPNISSHQMNSNQTPFEYFTKPMQPMNWPNNQQNPNAFSTPESFTQQPGILAQFQNENGQVDLNKMISTVGQLANTVQQVTPVVKQINDLFKTFR